MQRTQQYDKGGQALATAYAKAFAANEKTATWERVAKLEEKNAQLWTTLGQRDKALAAMMGEVEQHKSNVDVHAADKARAVAEIQRLQGELAEAHTQRATSSQRADEMRGTLLQTKDDIHQLVQTSVHKYSEEVDTLRRHLVDERRKFQEQGSQLKQLKAERSTEIERDATVCELRKQLDHVQRRNRSVMQNTEDKHRERVASLEQEVAELTGENSRLKVEKAQIREIGAHHSAIVEELTLERDDALAQGEDRMAQLQVCAHAVHGLVDWIKQSKEHASVGALVEGEVGVEPSLEKYDQHTNVVLKDINYLRSLLIKYYADEIAMNDQCAMQ